MKKDVVSFEIAKLLKEKGFDEPTKILYEHALTSQKDSETKDYTGPFGWKCGETNLTDGYFINSHAILDHSDKNWFMCAAPSPYQVVEWLRVNKKIHVWVTSREKEDGSGEIWYIPCGRKYPLEKIKGLIKDVIPYTPRSNPQEALDIGLLHIVQNLI